MKSAGEIFELLIQELSTYQKKSESSTVTLDYLNEVLGDTSFLLAGLLESIIRNNEVEWGKDKWIDDSLLIKANFTKENLIVEGFMIWGDMKSTNQWVDPFTFQIGKFSNGSFSNEFTFFFCDLDKPEISYEKYKNERNYWSTVKRKWKYILTSDKSIS